MSRPAAPSDVVATSPATSSWANSVTDAIQAIIADLYGVADVEIEWAEVINKPATFAPSAHTHDYAAEVTGKPATFAPSAHTHDYAAEVTGKPATFAPSAHTHSEYVTGYATPATAGGFRVYRGTSTPTGMSEGDVWIKG